jgi:chromosome partitioning protein
MKTIAIGLQKGGTGKTSVAVSLAAELARIGGETVLIDLDPQGNAGSWIGPDNIKAELAGVLLKKYALDQALIPAGVQGLSLIPTAGLGGELKIFAEGQAVQQPFCVKSLVRELSSSFRFCVIDLPPAFGALERAALIAADEVITPIVPDPFGVDGLHIFAANLASLRSNMETDKPAYKRIIVSALDCRIKQHREIFQSIGKSAKGFHIYCFPVDQVFRRAQTAGKVIQEMDAKKDTLAEINRLALDIAKE